MMATQNGRTPSCGLSKTPGGGRGWGKECCRHHPHIDPPSGGLTLRNVMVPVEREAVMLKLLLRPLVTVRTIRGTLDSATLVTRS
jgi:hypothetical protein